ncbi:HAD-like protein [Mycena sanguinolenta]|nr:HAD-like protein [Mycena sanguinolenta]
MSHSSSSESTTSFIPCSSTPASSPSASLHGKQLFPDAPRQQYDNIIFDIGDVLFTWSAETKTTISASTLRKILRSATWFEYEKGNLGETECYDLVASEFKLESSEVAAAFQGARDSLAEDPKMIAMLHELKASGARLFAMSNISVPDWEVLRHKGKREDWELFEHVFTSAAARERKPNLGYFRHVLSETGIDSERTAFVDDKLENVLTGRSLGFRGIVFTKFEDVERQLKVLFRDPVHWRCPGGEFAQLLILEATGDPSLVDYIEYPRLSNFFKSEGVLTTSSFPCDQDTTSIALSVAPHFTAATKQSVMDEILSYRNEDNIVTTYFDRTRPRIDPIVCINVLTFFHMNGRGEELSATLDWVVRGRHPLLLWPDPFFFFLSRLIAVSPSVRERFGPLFASRISKLFGSTGDALALSMRVLAAAVVGLCDIADHDRLLAMQELDGSWPMGWVYKYGAVDILIGTKGLTTALAVNALKEVYGMRVD